MNIYTHKINASIYMAGGYIYNTIYRRGVSELYINGLYTIFRQGR